VLLGTVSTLGCVHGHDRRHAQLAVRIGGLVFVVAWLFSATLQGIVPFWLPFLVLALTEIEFVARAWWDSRAGHPGESTQSARSRRLPGADDADLGWTVTENEEGDTVLVPAPPRKPPARRRRTATAVGAAVAVALFATAMRVDARDAWSSVSSSERRRAEARFSSEATRIAGTPVRVVCDAGYSFTGVGSDAAGVAFPRQRLAYLEPSVCRSLYRIAFEGDVGSREDAAWAVTVLAHEAVHLRGVRPEGVTECYALQEGALLGRRLGLAPSEADALMRAQLARDRGDRSIDRAAYRLPAGCVNDGELDLRPRDPSFP
jgi:hypothetical protein